MILIIWALNMSAFSPDSLAARLLAAPASIAGDTPPGQSRRGRFPSGRSCRGGVPGRDRARPVGPGSGRWHATGPVCRGGGRKLRRSLPVGDALSLRRHSGNRCRPCWPCRKPTCFPPLPLIRPNAWLLRWRLPARCGICAPGWSFATSDLRRVGFSLAAPACVGQSAFGADASLMDASCR